MNEKRTRCEARQNKPKQRGGHDGMTHPCHDIVCAVVLKQPTTSIGKPQQRPVGRWSHEIYGHKLAFEKVNVGFELICAVGMASHGHVSQSFKDKSALLIPADVATQIVHLLLLMLLLPLLPLRLLLIAILCCPLVQTKSSGFFVEGIHRGQ